jgi:iron complex outermembrane receptor protein
MFKPWRLHLVDGLCSVAWSVLLVIAVPGLVLAQVTATLQITVRSDAAPVAAATVTIGTSTYSTADDGTVAVTLPPGAHTISASRDGLAPASLTVTLTAGQVQTLTIDLAALTHAEEVTVSATRTGRRLDDQPLRVEVLEREEIEEKMLMTPGDIVMMLNEMGGMRVQATSPALGAASVRVQGMRGRYTRVLSDGLPLYGDTGGLGLLQIPPMDLGRVEVIKGVASSLYGAGAMGGVVNLISRRPGSKAEREMLLNRTSRGGTDAVGWYATPLGDRFAMTLLGGGHFQDRSDVDDDGWSDVPGYSRGVIRPRLFWGNGGGRTVFATAGFTAEERTGGGTAAGSPYREALSTRRVDAGFVTQVLFGQGYLLGVRAAFTEQRHVHRFGDLRERDRHGTAFGEVTLRRQFGAHTMVAGAALERDQYRPTDVPAFAYTFTVPGVFVQDDVDVARWLSISASARVDWHNVHGTLVSPKISGLLRAGGWSSRLSFGRGFFASSPLTEETEAVGLTRLQIPAPLRAEKGRNATLDVSRTTGPLSYTVTVFRSRVEHPLHIDRSSGLVLRNLETPLSIGGAEVVATLGSDGDFSVTGTYSYVAARQSVGGVAEDLALTPRHSAGIIGMWEREDTGRVGIELYVTGAQRLEDNPFRSSSPAYTVMGVLAERQIGRMRLFINGENLTGVRQTGWDPLVRPTRAADGQWTVDAWAPLDGRTINGGLRIGF